MSRGLTADDIKTASYVQRDGALVPIASLSAEEIRRMPDKVACCYFRGPLRRYGAEITPKTANRACVTV